MSGVRIVVGAALVAAMLLPASAQAGTYDVVSCRAPGAGGVNLAWRAGYGAYPDPARISPGTFDVVEECPGPRTFLLARSLARDGVDAPWPNSAYFRFDAPAGNAISNIQIWRHGQVLLADGTDGGYDDWDLVGRTDDGELPGEKCLIPPGQSECNLGARPDLNGKNLVPGALATYALDTTYAEFGVTCNPPVLKNCPTANGAPHPYASYNLWGSIVTVRDDVRPSLAASGGLWADGWRRPNEALQYEATDSAGVRSVQVQVGAVTSVANGDCDYRRPAPCPGRLTGSLTLGAAPPDGPQPAVVTAADAAGNTTSSSRTVLVDGNAPLVRFRRPRSRNLVVGISERASGVAAGQIFVRQRADKPFRALPTELRRRALRARLDRGRPSRTDVRVLVRDNAGNEASGSPTRLLLTSVRAGDRRLPIRRGMVRGRFGRTITFRGKLRDPRGRPISGVPVTVISRPSSRSPFAQEAATTTSPTGRFVLRMPPGTTRRVVLGFQGSGESLPARKTLRLAVPASSTIRASRRRLGGPGVVRFSGRVRRGGRGLIVVLQGYERGRWRTFADTRTGSRGSWRARYRFSGRPGSYPVRARIRPQRGFPYATGYSRPIVVRVG